MTGLALNEYAVNTLHTHATKKTFGHVGARCVGTFPYDDVIGAFAANAMATW